MNKEELIGKLQMVYVGDINALNELIGYYDGLKQEIEIVQQQNQKYKEVIDRATKNEEEIMYLANKVAITTQNLEIKAVRDRLEEIFKILKEVE
jgi:hypothetical protein